MTVDIGSAFRRQTEPDYGPLADLVSGMRESITEEVSRAVVANVTAAITQVLVGGLTIPAPIITVAAPEVTVTPTINIPGEDDAGEIEAADRQTAMLRQINDRLTSIQGLLARPVIREVERDNNGLIIRITETR